ncbi:MAG: heterodisulfide reductase-related iron-sulfur binding cluster [Pseudomonadota bacterium]
MTPDHFNLSYFIYIGILILSLLFFAYSVVSRIKIMMRTSSIKRFDKPLERFIVVLKYMFAQTKLFYDPIPGLAHALIFWGFCVIAIESINFFLSALVVDLRIPFTSGYYFIFLEAFTVLVILAVAYCYFRRLFIKPDRLELTKEAHVILGLILVLMLTYFTMTMAEGTIIGKMHRLKYASLALYPMFSGFSYEFNVLIYGISWWIHLLSFLFFLNLLPYSKHMHVLTVLFNVFFSDLDKKGKMKKLDLENSESFGISNLAELTWKDVLDGFTCTECGRCTELCPANKTEKSLNPKEIILKIRDYVYANYKIKEDEKLGNILEEFILKKDIWSCTTCHACVTACPVLNEHLPKIFGLRQNQVLMEGDFPEEAQLVCKNIENNSNPWGIGSSERDKVLLDLDVPRISEKPDAEYLLYLGCAASFDERNKKVAKSLIKILKKAGVSFAVLGNEEKCCGETVRRIGNEYLFQMIAEENKAIFENYKIKKVITSCPHCFNTFKNEYPCFGLDLEVVHHTQFIDMLIKEGKLDISSKTEAKITYHDSCYLGRYNDIYNEPRSILQKICSNVFEMPNSKRKSFCCGAGGGRMWMEETEGKRINIERAKQALATDADKIVVSCPYCLTMFEDAMKDLGENKEILDISEIV